MGPIIHMSKATRSLADARMLADLRDGLVIPRSAAFMNWIFEPSQRQSFGNLAQGERIAGAQKEARTAHSSPRIYDPGAFKDAPPLTSIPVTAGSTTAGRPGLNLPLVVNTVTDHRTERPDLRRLLRATRLPKEAVSEQKRGSKRGCSADPITGLCLGTDHGFWLYRACWP
jgi:hypothetical protein